ncbi:MAG: FtsX-like permease family protein [Candidatus Marinimicrobia bacterium]|nr:FtsX-like permease family protein [bacterium]MCG2715523.1 FtsX-like permease family protein [Candidatus Neomarinimicrobiota bacterium]
MLAIKLAYRNLIGAGLRTWLNVFVLSLSFLVIIWHRGIINGWDRQARNDTMNQEIGGGQYWHENYDPYDPFTLTDAHGIIHEKLQSDDNYAPVLVAQATIYPGGRVQSVLLKGIEPAQKVLTIPTEYLESDAVEIPVMLGSRMAENNKLKIGDFVTVRWRDANGTFDAADAKVVHIFKTNVPMIDNGQMWVSLKRLQKIMQMDGEATMVVTSQDITSAQDLPHWLFKDYSILLKEFDEMIKMKNVGGLVMWFVLLLLAWIAIFDTQVLSIFRRQKEIGTDIALGMTRGQVIRIFTIEGAMHGILAAILAAIYGAPLLYLQAVKGMSMPEGTDDMGLVISDTIYPYYTIGLVVVTAMVVLITTTIVSFLPTRRISKMNPTDAIRGKIQ